MKIVIKSDKELSQALMSVSMLAPQLKEKSFDLEIKEHRKRRSLNANNYFHLLVGKIAEKLQIGNDECKEKLNLEYGTPIKIDEDTLFACKVPANADIKAIIKYPKYVKTVIENGKELNVYMAYKETHTLDTKEMSRLIDLTVEEAKSLGIETKTPDEIAQLVSLWESER